MLRRFTAHLNIPTLFRVGNGSFVPLFRFRRNAGRRMSGSGTLQKLPKHTPHFMVVRAPSLH
jgi:hypothetical protein